MEGLEDQIIAKIIPEERINKKYMPLRDELETVDAQIEKLNQPSANLDQKKIDTIIKFVKQLPKLYRAFTKPQRKQFLKWFVETVWIKNKQIVEVTYKESFQALISLELVRIRQLWLPK